jgi:hypothetical protein
MVQGGSIPGIVNTFGCHAITRKHAQTKALFYDTFFMSRREKDKAEHPHRPTLKTVEDVHGFYFG